MANRHVLFLLFGLLVQSCGDPVARNVEILMSGGPDREEAMMELLFAKSKALPVILGALEDPGGPGPGRADLVEILWKLHVRESDARIVPALTELVDDDAPEVRRAVAVAFGDMGEKDMIAPLLAQFLMEGVEAVQLEQLQALEILDEWEIRRGQQQGPAAAVNIGGGDALSEEERRRFAAKLEQITAATTNDTLRDTADEILEKMAGQLVLEGDRLILEADLIGAEEQYRKALSQRPGSSFARQRLGQLFLFNEQPERGLAMLEQGGMVLRAPRLRRAPVVDGDLGDAVWREAARVDSFSQCIYVLRVVPAEGRSEAYVGHTDTSLWIGVRGYEEDTRTLTAARDTRDGDVYMDDCVEVHVDIDLDRSSFHQFVVNSIGTIADYYQKGGGWDTQGQQWDGLHNVATRVEPTYWTLEMEVPLAAMGVDGVRPGDLWGFNIARVRIAHDGEYDQWTPTYGFSGRADRFGLLQFE